MQDMSFKGDAPPIHAHIRTQIIAAQASPGERHALFNNMLTSIKEQSHKIFVLSFFLLFFFTSELWRVGVEGG